MSIMLAAQPYTRFVSPEDRAATEPPELRGLRRDGVRLMVATPAGIQHTFFCRLADQLSAGDVLVVTDARRREADFHLLVGQTQIGFRERLTFVETLFLHEIEHGQERRDSGHN